MTEADARVNFAMRRLLKARVKAGCAGALEGDRESHSNHL